MLAPASVLVLVADADRFRRHAAERALGALGHQTVSAADRGAALSTVAERDCDLVLADARMAAADEFELVRTLRQHARAVPVVVVAPAPPAFQRRAFAAGVSAFIPEATLLALQRVLAFRFATRTHEATRPRT